MKKIYCLLLLLPVFVTAQILPRGYTGAEDSFSNHKLVLDPQGKILPWYQPAAFAYDQFLRKRWDFVKKAPMSPGTGITANYPQYYFYCAYDDLPDTIKANGWMNDIGEKIPNWFESARLYYAYTGDASVMKIVKDLADYHLKNGRSDPSFAWPHFPYATANAGAAVYDGFTEAKKFFQYETQVDHSGDIGFTYLKLYFFYEDDQYLRAATKVADVLAANARKGTLTKSPWPYIVNAKTGVSRDEYGANWMGCYNLLNKLANMKAPNHAAYRKACTYVRDFLLQYPVKTGFWTDGHSDNFVNNPQYKSNMSASNFKLFLFDHPEFDPAWKQHMPELIRWTEEYFIHRSANGEKGTLWGANIVGEQDSFMFKMDYQTARYAAECARWYAVSGDQQYKEKAFRSLNLVTYCSDSNGRANESPLSKGIANWWSDCYGECPMMFYPIFAAIPEWTPPGENHILYAPTVLNKVQYQPDRIIYQATENVGIEYLHLNFKPARVLLNKQSLPIKSEANRNGYTIRRIRNNDYALKIHRNVRGNVAILKK